MQDKTLVHIVSFQESEKLMLCLEALDAARRQGMDVVLTDNASDLQWIAEIKRKFPWLTVNRNAQNLGFCAAHNQGAALCLAGDYDGMLVLNPDVYLRTDTLNHLWTAIHESNAHAATPLLLRSDNPKIVDAAGMYFTKSLRHFDRFAGTPIPSTLTRVRVAGGTGACLLVTREFMTRVAIPRVGEDEAIWRIYPQLRRAAENRIQLFDEAFFAYREDAELALRSLVLSLKTVFVPKAVALHGRALRPADRSNFLLNRLGVRNRFLIQLTVVPLPWLIFPLWQGTVRNLLVIAGVLLRERSSIQGLSEAKTLSRRAWMLKKKLFSSVDRIALKKLAHWFNDEPYTEIA